MTSEHQYDKVAVEGRPTTLSEKRSIAWRFCAFADMPQKNGERFRSKSLECHGFSWYLALYPRGNRTSTDGEEFVSVYLCKKKGGGKAVKAEFSFRLGSSVRINTISVNFENAKTGHGCPEIVKRDKALTLLTNGDLLIEVDLQVHVDSAQPLLPKYNFPRAMLDLLQSGKRSDVTYIVGGTEFRAHLCVLDTGAPILAELADDAESGENIIIENVDHAMFKALLECVYGADPPPLGVMKRDARGVLDVADRFGCVNLKLYAESWLVESDLNKSTAAELLLLAEAKSCALLKESAMKVIKANAKSVMASPGWEDVMKSTTLTAEIMEAALVPQSFVAGGDDDVEKMDVTTLRRKLQEEDLSEDGTRKMLVDRIKGHAAKKRRTEG